MKEINKLALLLLLTSLGTIANTDNIELESNKVPEKINPNATLVVDGSGIKNQVESLNVKLHELDIQSKMSKAFLIREKARSDLIISQENRITDKVVNDNNNTMKEMRSKYELILNSHVHDIKMGIKAIDDIPPGFMKNKVYSILLSDKNEVQNLLADIEELDKQLVVKDEIIALKQQEITMVEQKIIKIIKQTKTERSLLLKRHSKQVGELKTSIKLIKAKLNQDTGDEGLLEVTESPVDKQIIVISMKVGSVLKIGKYKKVSISFDYRLPFISDEIKSIKSLTIINPKRINIPDFGNLIVKFHKDTNIGFYNSTKLIKTIAYR